MPDFYHVLKDDRGQWGFSDNDSHPMPESGSFDSQREAFDALRGFLGSKGLAVKQTQNLATGMLVETRPAYLPNRPDITLRTSILPELGDLIDKLSAELGLSTVQTIAQALIMLDIIVDAGNQGKRLAITDHDLEFEREILIPGRSHADR